MNVEVLSPAKINPELCVLRRLESRMHAVDTTLLALDVCDRVRLSRRDEDTEVGVRLELSGEGLSDDVPADAANLACRAVQCVLTLARERGLAQDVGLDVAIDKRIPSRAGLGGGSSNAAAAALGAARILGLAPDDPELLQALAALGADTAFFLVARATGFARCRGVGEKVEPLPLASSERAFVVLTPRVTCSTADVYGALDPSEWTPDATTSTERFWIDASLDDARSRFKNGLEAAALRSHPDLARVRAGLDGLGASHFRLSGSGSSFFGLYDDLAAAKAFLESDAVATIARDHGLRAAFAARALGSGVQIRGG